MIATETNSGNRYSVFANKYPERKRIYSLTKFAFDPGIFVSWMMEFGTGGPNDIQTVRLRQQPGRKTKKERKREKKKPSRKKTKPKARELGSFALALGCGGGGRRRGVAPRRCQMSVARQKGAAPFGG